MKGRTKINIMLCKLIPGMWALIQKNGAGLRLEYPPISFNILTRLKRKTIGYIFFI